MPDIPKRLLRSFLFYTNNYRKDNIQVINKSLTDGNFVFQNVSFLSCGKRPPIPQTNLIIDDIMCGRKLDGALNIVQLSDSGARYYIYNDKLCSQYKLPQFISGLKITDLAVESLSQKNFCQKFIVKY